MQAYTKLVLAGVVLQTGGMACLLYSLIGYSRCETPPLVLNACVAAGVGSGCFLLLLGFRYRKAALIGAGPPQSISPSAWAGYFLCSLGAGAPLGFVPCLVHGVLLQEHPVRDMGVFLGLSLALTVAGAILVQLDFRGLSSRAGAASLGLRKVCKYPVSTGGPALLYGVDAAAVAPLWDAVLSIGMWFFPELHLLATKEEQRAALALARRHNVVFQGAYMLILFAAAQGAGLLAVPYLANRVGTQTSVTLLVVFGASLLACAVGLSFGLCVAEFSLLGRRMRRTLRQALLDSGVPVCEGCGYDLRGLSSERCPECGARRTLIVAGPKA